MSIRTFDDWHHLPEISCPDVDVTETVEIYVVHSVGFLALLPVECKGVDHAFTMFSAGRFFFPLVEIELADSRTPVAFRLPTDLCDWVIDTMPIPRELFPRKVEFGRVAGVSYARVL